MAQMDAQEVIEQAESIIASRRQTAADRLGREVDQVQAIKLEIAAMRENGLLVDLDIHGVSQFQARVSYSELGIASDDPRAERLRTGRKDLFPQHSKKLRSLEARARQNLENNSHRVGVFGQWRWLPWSSYDSFISRHTEIVAEMEAVKANILSHYDEVREENRAYFAKIALRAWKDMLAQYSPGDRVVIVTTDHFEFDSQADRDRFIEYVVQRALGKMPLPEEIEQDIRIDYKTSILYGDSEMAADDAALEKAKAEVAKLQAEEAEAQNRAFDAESAKRLAQVQEEARIASIKAAEMEHAREQLAQMGSPIQEALDALRANVYDAVSTLLASLRRNSGFKGRASTKAAELYDTWKRLNGGLLQDEKLDAALQRLDAEMRQYGRNSREERETQLGDITSQLAEIAALTNEEARKIRKSGTSRAAGLDL